MPRSDLGSSIVLILFGVIVAFESWRMPRFESIGGTIYSAPGLVPGLLGAVIALFGAIMLIRYLTHKGAPQEATTTLEAAATPGIADDQAAYISEPASDEAVAPVVVVGSEEAGYQPASMQRMLVTLVLAVIFGGFMIGNMPFWLAVFIFVSVSIIYYEFRAMKGARSTITRLAIALLIGGATAFAVPYLFENIFLVNLP